jgi:hypothetical protein
VTELSNNWMDRWGELVDKSRLLLRGYVRGQPNGLRVKKYLAGTADDDMEAQCRAALATLLSTGQPPREICELLAALIAPDGSAAAGDRKLNFVFRGKGRRRDQIRDTAIANRVYELVRAGKSVQDAAAAVAPEVGMDEENVRVIWKRDKAHRDAGHWPT